MAAGPARTSFVQAPAPARLIEGGLPTQAMVAQVLVAKYADHLPLYQQAQIYARQGVTLDRSRLADWVGRAAFLLRPVHERLMAELRLAAETLVHTRAEKLFRNGSQICAYKNGNPRLPADGRPGAGSLAHSRRFAAFLETSGGCIVGRMQMTNRFLGSALVRIGGHVKSLVLAAAALLALGVSPALAECNISDAKLEEAILHKRELRNPANRQMVRDLRALRDSAFILWSYGRHDDCERVLVSIRDLVASPSMGSLGDNDEDDADQQLAAREPMAERGGKVTGRRGDADAQPLTDVNELGPGLRADEILGAEVRSADDKIIGEVRNVVIGTKDREDYVVVASGGFFIAGKDSIVVPLRSLRVSKDRKSFSLHTPESGMRNVPLMPDQDYTWLSDDAFRERNDALFKGPN